VSPGMKLFVDTGPFMANHNKRDRDHTTTVESFDKFRRGETSYTTIIKAFIRIVISFDSG